MINFLLYFILHCSSWQPTSSKRIWKCGKIQYLCCSYSIQHWKHFNSGKHLKVMTLTWDVCMVVDVEYDQRNWNVSVKNSSAHAQPCGRNGPILSALHTHTDIKCPLCLSHTHIHRAVQNTKRLVLMLFVIGVPASTSTTCAGMLLRSKKEMMQRMQQVQSTVETKSLASGNVWCVIV